MMAPIRAACTLLYRASVEHLFARLWQWRIVRNVWTHCAAELYGHVCILHHLTQFCICR